MQRNPLVIAPRNTVDPARSAETELALKAAKDALRAVMRQINEIILGKEDVVQLTLACLLARGHLLIEDLPGVGKTTLAHAVARSLGLTFQRIQFTSDLLPADVLGTSIFDRESSNFRFHPGPIFTQVLLADEINRATPKTQSALLEAMEERQVTVDGGTRALPNPFFVVATQNPSSQLGTFPLPESQLDRFLLRIHLGLPDAKAERALLAGEDRRELLNRATALISLDQLTLLQQAVRAIHISEPLLDYAQALLSRTRSHPDLLHGLSPRCGVLMLQAARAWAFLQERDYVIPEDVQRVFSPVVSHRLQNVHGAGGTVDALIKTLLESVSAI